MFCIACGTALLENANFCAKCGTPRAVVPGRSEPPPATPQPSASPIVPPTRIEGKLSELPTVAFPVRPQLPKPPPGFKVPDAYADVVGVAEDVPPTRIVEPASLTLPPPPPLDTPPMRFDAAPTPAAPPMTIAPPMPVEAPPRHLEGLQPIVGRSNAAIALLLIGVLIDVVGMISTMFQINLMSAFVPGQSSLEDVTASDQRQMLIGIVQMVTYLLTAIVFLMWLSRAYRNAGIISRRGLPYGTGWAVGAWFVPFLNLIRPFQIVKETYVISATPLDEEPGILTYEPPVPALLRLWWGAFLISGFLAQIALRMVIAADNIADFISASSASVFSDLVSVVAAILCALVVRLVTKTQQRVIAAAV